MGRCGMTQAQAARTSFTEFLLRHRGAEEVEHERWELARWSAWHAYNLSPFLKPGNRPKRPQDIVTFPWEEDPKKKAKERKVTRKMARITDAERNALDAIMKDFYQRKYSS